MQLLSVKRLLIQSWRSLWQGRSPEQMWDMLQDRGEDLPGSSWRESSFLHGRIHAAVQEVRHDSLRCYGVRQVLERGGEFSRLNDHDFDRTASVRR